ncbi:hypothetical protein ACHAXR_004343 [Thalassiosira sp. AJA248-18]
MAANYQHRRRRTALLVILAGTAALSLQTLITPQLWDAVDRIVDDNGNHELDVEHDDEKNDVLSLMEEMEMSDRFHRILIAEDGLDLGGDDAELLAIPGQETGDASQHDVTTIAHPLAGASNGGQSAESYEQLIDNEQPLPPYNIQDAVDSSKMFDRTYALLVYDPRDDAFNALYSKHHKYVAAYDKLTKSIAPLVRILRTLFPERFQGKKSDELVIPISSGDYPGVKPKCLDYYRPKALVGDGNGCQYNAAPILNFGSIFRQPHIFPSMIAMPMPEAHSLPCFGLWAKYGRVCNELRPAGHDMTAKMVFGEEFGLHWETHNKLMLASLVNIQDLIPQVVWRGTDFSYLTIAQPKLRKPQFQEKLVKWPWSDQSKREWKTKKIGGLTARRYTSLKREQARSPQRDNGGAELMTNFNKAAAVSAMKEQYKDLLPRWQAVVLTAGAEVEAESQPTGPDGSSPLPWANMKFSQFVRSGAKISTMGAEQYKEWEDIGFAAGNYMGRRTLAGYKYHIDLGGGGGTTWTGTIQKLAMPGLLFHHMTPTKDYIHNWIKPWVHFIPVSSDLRDLKRKFDWAESHPEQSQKIAKESTMLMRYLTSPEGFEQMFKADMVEPLRRVIEAYQPVSTMHSSTSWRTWREALRNIEGGDALFSATKCSGNLMWGCKGLGKMWLKKKMR